MTSLTGGAERLRPFQKILTNEYKVDTHELNEVEQIRDINGIAFEI